MHLSQKVLKALKSPIAAMPFTSWSSIIMIQSASKYRTNVPRAVKSWPDLSGLLNSGGEATCCSKLQTKKKHGTFRTHHAVAPELQVAGPAHWSYHLAPPKKYAKTNERTCFPGQSICKWPWPPLKLGVLEDDVSAWAVKTFIYSKSAWWCVSCKLFWRERLAEMPSFSCWCRQGRQSC